MRKILVDFAIVTKAVRLRNLAARFQIIGATNPLASLAGPLKYFVTKRQNPALPIRLILSAHSRAVWPMVAARIAQNLESLN